MSHSTVRLAFRINNNNIIIDDKILWIPNYGYYGKQKNVNIIEEIISMTKDNI